MIGANQYVMFTFIQETTVEFLDVVSYQLVMKSGGEITHAVLNGSIVSKPAGW